MKKKRETGKRSIYFVLWTTFTAFSCVIVLLLGISQSHSVKDTYERVAMENVYTTGDSLRKKLDHIRPSLASEEELNAFFLQASMSGDTRAYLFDSDANVLYPSIPEHSIDETFQSTVKSLVEKLSAEESALHLKQTDRECIYIYRESGFNGNPSYLVVTRPGSFDHAMLREVNGRTVLIAIFVIIVSFGLSATVAGFLVKPLSEMTEKAKRLAAGDFSVDFNGQSYGAETDALAKTLNFARDELSKTDAMQKELIANVSHDFKTPLTMIKAYASMIQEISGNDPVKREKHAQVIIDEADRLAELVSDVLDLSKISSGLNEIRREVFNLSSFTAQIMEKFSYLSETQGYVFVTNIEDNLYTEADRVKIGQVVYNLVGNAVNYTGENKKVFVSLRREENCILLSVKDTGAGVPEAELQNIWSRYYRSKETHKRPVKGTGLGLSIVKTVLDKHDFRYGVRSQEGHGCEFYVLFPLL